MTDIVKQESVLASYNPEQLEILRTQIAKKCDDNELKFFLTVCKHVQLDPFKKQIYAVKRRNWNPDKKAYDESMVIQTGIDGFRTIAERTQKYAGSKAPRFTYKENGTLESAIVVVKKLIGGQIVETEAEAYYDEYVQKVKNKETNQMEPNKQWQTMPRLMLGKCAEALALRKAFPDDLSGLYSEEEVQTIQSHDVETNTEEMASDEDIKELSQNIEWSGVPAEKFYTADGVTKPEEYTKKKITARIAMIKKRLEEKAEEKPATPQEPVVEAQVEEANK